MHAVVKLCLAGLACVTASPLGQAAQPVRVAVVHYAPASAMQVLSGSVQPRTRADLAFRVGGKVVSRPVDIGQHVKAGQVIAVLDLSDLKLAEDVATAAMQAAAADAVNARAEFSRYEQLGKRSAAYLPSEYDKRAAAWRMAQARVAQAAQQLALARDQRGYGTLSADADGVITALPVQVGQIVSIGQTVATLAHTADVEVAADVPENMLAEVRATTDVTLGLWADPTVKLRGRVREIGAMADAVTRTFAVRMTVLDPPPGLLALGMTATVRFGGSGAPVAALPATALFDVDGSPAIWVLDPARQRAKLSKVSVAAYRGDGTVLVRQPAGGAAPAEGDQVITAGVGQVEPDMAVVAWRGAMR